MVKFDFRITEQVQADFQEATRKADYKYFLFKYKSTLETVDCTLKYQKCHPKCYEPLCLHIKNNFKDLLDILRKFDMNNHRKALGCYNTERYHSQFLEDIKQGIISRNWSSFYSKYKPYADCIFEAARNQNTINFEVERNGTFYSSFYAMDSDEKPRGDPRYSHNSGEAMNYIKSFSPQTSSPSYGYSPIYNYATNNNSVHLETKRSKKEECDEDIEESRPSSGIKSNYTDFTRGSNWRTPKREKPANHNNKLDIVKTPVPETPFSIYETDKNTPVSFLQKSPKYQQHESSESTDTPGPLQRILIEATSEGRNGEASAREIVGQRQSSYSVLSTSSREPVIQREIAEHHNENETTFTSPLKSKSNDISVTSEVIPSRSNPSTMCLPEQEHCRMSENPVQLSNTRHQSHATDDSEKSFEEAVGTHSKVMTCEPEELKPTTFVRGSRSMQSMVRSSLKKMEKPTVNLDFSISEEAEQALDTAEMQTALNYEMRDNIREEFQKQTHQINEMLDCPTLLFSPDTHEDSSFQRRIKEQEEAHRREEEEMNEKRREQQRKFQETIRKAREASAARIKALIACLLYKQRFEEQEEMWREWIEECRKPIIRLKQCFSELSDNVDRVYKKLSATNLMNEFEQEKSNLWNQCLLTYNLLENDFNELKELQKKCPQVVFIRILQKCIADVGVHLLEIKSFLEKSNMDYSNFTLIRKKFFPLSPEMIYPTWKLREVCANGNVVEKDIEFPEIQSNLVIVEE